MYKKNDKIVVGTSEKDYKKVIKTLVYDRKRRESNGKISFTWYRMGGKRYNTNNGTVEIWICIHRKFRKRTDDKLYYKIHNEKRLKTPEFLTYYSVFCRDR